MILNHNDMIINTKLIYFMHKKDINPYLDIPRYQIVINETVLNFSGKTDRDLLYNTIINNMSKDEEDIKNNEYLNYQRFIKGYINEK